MTRAAEGTPGLVLVGGEAGVGKSRLLSELAAWGVNDGLRGVLLGQCVELDEATIPLLPVADALGGLAADGALDLPSAAVGPAGGTLAEGPSSRLHVVVLDRLAEAAAADPIVLVIEDVHWADRSTLERAEVPRAPVARRAHPRGGDLPRRRGRPARGAAAVPRRRGNGPRGAAAWLSIA